MTDRPSQGHRAAEAATPWGARLLGWPLINIVAAVLAVLLGAWGWYQTDSSLPPDEIVYRTLALFAINFAANCRRRCCSTSLVSSRSAWSMSP